jgi:hypothetical protein
MTRGMLLEVVRGRNQIREAKNNEEGRGELPFGIQLPEIPELPTLEIPKEEEAAKAPGPKLYVRDDGTLDWDGALQDRAALRKFGSAVWARINGQNPTVLGEEEEEDEKEKGGKKKGGKTADSKAVEHAPPERVTARIEDTAEILEARERLAQMEATFKDMQVSHTALLASGKCFSYVRFNSLDLMYPVVRLLSVR